MFALLRTLSWPELRRQPWRSLAAIAAVRLGGRVVAVGSACFSQGWCGIHGMRTAPAARGSGCATAILAAFGQLAIERGVHRVFLQVEAANATARSVYERAGFGTAWCSEYWRRG